MNKYYILITIIGFLLDPGFLQAQSALPLDTLELQDGKILVGKVLKYSSKRGVMMEQQGGYLVEISRDLIKNIVIQPTGKIIKSGKAKMSLKGDKSYAFREEGIYYTLNGGALFGESPQGDSDLGFGLQATTGLMFNRRLGVGVGLAFDNYSVTGQNGRQVMPVLAEVRGYLSDSNMAPFYVMQAGYGFAFKEENQGVQKANGGIMLHPAFGLRLGAREDVNFAFDLGYRFQRVTQVREFSPWSNETQEERIWYKRFALRFGMIF